MSTGKVKFFNISKGYGFIIEDGNEAEHFVHSTGLVDQINEGDSVEFELVDGKKGKKNILIDIYFHSPGFSLQDFNLTSSFSLI